MRLRVRIHVSIIDLTACSDQINSHCGRPFLGDWFAVASAGARFERMSFGGSCLVELGTQSVSSTGTKERIRSRSLLAQNGFLELACAFNVAYPTIFGKRGASLCCCRSCGSANIWRWRCFIHGRRTSRSCRRGRSRRG